MRSRAAFWSFTIIAGTYLLSGCDTERNMGSGAEDYYVKLVGKDGDQSGTDMAVAADGSIYLLGNTVEQDGDRQVYVLRTTSAGMVVWETTLGGNTDEEARDIEILQNGQLAVLATVIDPVSSTKDFALTILGTDMTVINSIEDGMLNYDDEALSVSETTDGFIVSGHTVDTAALGDPADAFFRRYDTNLNNYSTTWTATLGGDGDFDVAVKTIEVGTEFYVFGYSNVFQPDNAVADYNAVIWKLGTTGINVNTIAVGNTHLPGTDTAADEIVSSVSTVPGGGYMMTGYSREAGIEQRIFVLRLRQDLSSVTDSNLDQVIVGSPLVDQGSFSSISESARTSVFASPASGFFVLGTVNDNIYLKKLSGSGLADAWTDPPSFQFGGIGIDSPGAVIEADGRILLIGTMVLGDATGQQKIVLIKLNPDGKLRE